jgi:N-acylglucosamine 2-epimerase
VREKLALLLQPYYDRYRTELFDRILPFWMKHAPDPEYGGIFTCLDRDGSIYDTRKYVWMNGRAAWTFARLYNSVEKRPEWLAFSESCIRFLRQNAYTSEGHIYFSLTREGGPAFVQRKPYSAVFVALGLLEYAAAVDDADCRREGVALFHKVTHWIANPHKLGRPTYGPPASQLADIMVIALLAMEIVKFDSSPVYTGWLDWSLNAVQAHHDPRRRILFENAMPENPEFRSTPEGRFVCPGSITEVGWFLLHVEKLRPNPAVRAMLLEVIEGALDFGWDPEYGGLFYFMDSETKPMLQLDAPMKLWWPHTEAMYACILAYKETGEEKWLRWLERLDAYAFEHFSDPEHGEWFGYCDRSGKLTHTLKGNNYKGAFHVPRFLLFSLQAMERERRPGPRIPN